MIAMTAQYDHSVWFIPLDYIFHEILILNLSWKFRENYFEFASLAREKLLNFPEKSSNFVEFQTVFHVNR